MVKNPKYIFCSTTKMSGIEYLSTVFTFDKWQYFTGMRVVKFDYEFINDNSYKDWDYLKENMGIIHLIRNPIYTARNLYEDGSIPGEDKTLIDPSDSGNMVNPEFLKYREFQHDFFKALWYCFEVYTRSKHLISRYRNMKHYVFFTKWFSDPKEIRSLVSSFGGNISKKNSEFVSGWYDEYGIYHRTNNILAPHNAERMAKRFVENFGDQFLLSKKECLQLLEL